MAVAKGQWGAATGITITLTSLADAALRQSASVDLGALGTPPEDVLIELETKGIAGGIDIILVWVAISVDAGTTFTGGASGSDAAFTGEVDDLVLLGAIKANTTVAKRKTWLLGNVLSAMPDIFSIIVENQSGAALSAAGGDHGLNYMTYNTLIT